jgi:hypothetical protein
VAPSTCCVGTENSCGGNGGTNRNASGTRPSTRHSRRRLRGHLTAYGGEPFARQLDVPAQEPSPSGAARRSLDRYRLDGGGIARPLALGLDPGLGWTHRDAPYRNSAALDLVEAVRPDIDDYVLDLLRERTFSRREFGELPTGQVRLAPLLAKLLAESTLGRWEEALTPHAKEIARTLAGAAGVRAPSATARGAARRAEGRSVAGHPKWHARRGRQTPVVCAASSCRSTSGAMQGSYVLTACRPSRPNEPRTSWERRGGRSRQCGHRRKIRRRHQRRRRSGPQPSQNGPVWLGSGSVRIPARTTERSSYVKCMPGLARVTLPAMVNATGLTSGYCFQIKRGKQTPQPMY